MSRAVFPGLSGWYCPAVRARYVNYTVRETGVNPAAREDGEHFCEVPEQKFYIRQPNKREYCGRDRTKAKTSLATEVSRMAELLPRAVYPAIAA